MILAIWFGLVVVVHLLRTATSSRASEPRPSCTTCGARFLDHLGVDLHRRATHPDTFDDRQVMPVEYRHTATNGDANGN